MNFERFQWIFPINHQISPTDYPDYSQQDYSQYAGQVKYESGDDEQKYRPAEQGNGSYDYR